MSKLEKLMHVVERNVKDYLREEAGVKDIKCKTALRQLSTLQLREVTSTISVAGSINMLLGFSYDEMLLQRVASAFLEEAQASKEECMDMAGEFINIILGQGANEIDMNNPSPTLFSPPMTMLGAKKVIQHKASQYYSIELETEYGNLHILCIGPKELFDTSLNYLGGE
ncbi:conserved hypothetical protein [Candidatus Terasakiella magnetica]|uniref:Chemotaxis phosphatase CheX-like domain-containing protein n=1 Tax=Candidatus Terasakiella magnetica TaxID=1867952 RepID=A0A1C3RI13_9PROT|nr:chemotaxis protein CheX [Candidatus Terasakiella magnetica]SCA56920.1 conserved hypothetical protein [Candidatus Terasakiella magnetica]